jgi:RIO1 family
LENPEKVYHQMMDLLVRFAENGLIHGDLNEFNTMVDEDQELFVLDFPQMVSVYHKEAEFYFQRDQKCIQTLFKRRFNFVSDRSHTLQEIKVTRRLDEEAKNIKFWQEQSKEDHAVIEGYMKERGAEQEQDDQDVIEDGDDVEDMQLTGQGPLDDEIPEDDDVPNEDLDLEAVALGDIEKELELLGAGSKPEPAPKFEVEAEEMTWEQLIDHREKMKELKKQAKTDKANQAIKKAKDQLEAMKTPITDSLSPETAKLAKTEALQPEDQSSSEDSDFIKRAVKKTLKKKKSHQGSKNHPKQQSQLMKNAL